MKHVVHLVVPAQLKQRVEGIFPGGKHFPGPDQVLLQDVLKDLNDLDPAEAQFGSFLVGHIQFLETLVNEHAQQHFELLNNSLILWQCEGHVVQVREQYRSIVDADILVVAHYVLYYDCDHLWGEKDLSELWNRRGLLCVQGCLLYRLCDE